MPIEFADLLFRLLPGLYRDKDTTEELRGFLEIIAGPLGDIDANIAALHDDRFIATCRPEFIALIGALIGAEVDPALSEEAQRAEVQHAIERYQTNGLRSTLERLAEDVTRWRVHVVDFSASVAQTVALDSTDPPRPFTIDITSAQGLERLGRSDDTASYSIDLRAPRHSRDTIGQKHFDNLGFFLTPSRVVVNQRPNALPAGSVRGRFTFDSRALEPGDDRGIRLQLLDGLDGRPITRRTLDGRERDFCGTRRGFTIRVHDISITDPTRVPPLVIRAANLEDFDHPIDPDGNDLPLEPSARGDEPRVHVAIDPEAGRFFINLNIVKATADDLRVDYLLGAVDENELGEAFPLSSDGRPRFAFSTDGTPAPLRDAFDGTPIAVSLGLGVPVSDYHGTARGWRIFHNGKDATALLAVEIGELPDDGEDVVPEGRVVVDPARGRLQFAPEFLAPGDRVHVSAAFEREATLERVVGNLRQRLPQALPAGVVPVLIDARKRSIDPAHLS
jgi:phage tail-like protein